MHNKTNPKIGWLKGSAGIVRSAARWMAGGL